MKKIKQIVGLILICVTSLFSCGEDKVNQVTSEVPEILTSNNEVSEYFAALDLFMEEYISMVESIVEASQEAEKKGGEPSLGDIMSMTTDLAGSMMKMAPLLERLDKLEKEADILKGNMTSEELEAFMNTYTKIMIRIVEMGQKLQ
jgi:uncharacterized coiled-coil DUF342 family protein